MRVYLSVMSDLLEVKTSLPGVFTPGKLVLHVLLLLVVLFIEGWTVKLLSQGREPAIGAFWLLLHVVGKDHSVPIRRAGMLAVPNTADLLVWIYNCLTELIKSEYQFCCVTEDR